MFKSQILEKLYNKHNNIKEATKITASPINNELESEILSMINIKDADSVNITKVVDPTGAGDVFAGAFTACLSAGQTSQSALLNASAMASICIESFGTERVQSASNDEIRERVDFLSKTVKS